MRTPAIIATLLLVTGLWAQDPSAHHVIPVTADLFTTDDLGNVYVLRGDELEIYDQHGKRGRPTAPRHSVASARSTRSIP
jgi:hypothetical protein